MFLHVINLKSLFLLDGVVICAVCIIICYSSFLRNNFEKLLCVIVIFTFECHPLHKGYNKRFVIC